MAGPLFLIVALGAILMEPVLLAAFPGEAWALQMPLVIVIYLGLDRPLGSAMAILLALILPVEWMVSGVSGVYSLALVIVFFLLQAVQTQIRRIRGLALGLVAALATALHGGVVMALLFVVGQGQTQLVAAVGWTLVPSMAIVAVLTVGWTMACRRLDDGIDPRRTSAGLKY